MNTGNHPPLTQFSEEEELFRRHVAEFAEKEIRPRVMEMDEAARVAPDILKKLNEPGLLSIEIPTEYGGSGGSFMQSILAIEELAVVDPTISVIVDVQNTLVINALRAWATPEQQQKYLSLLAGGTIASFALSESASGSDAFALQCRARETEGGYLLNGNKLWITNAGEAGLFLVMATVNPGAGYKGITTFLVEKDTAGFTVGKKENKLGIRASSTCELSFEDCFVPTENILGEVGKGYKIAIETLNEGRIGIGAQMAGLGRGALDQAVAYAAEREQFGQKLKSFQAVQHELAKMAVEVETARLLVYNAARRKEAGQSFLKEAAMAKYHASQVAESVASRALEIFGGNGFIKEYPMEKYYRDAKIGKIYEGTSFMQLNLIARYLYENPR